MKRSYKTVSRSAMARELLTQGKLSVDAIAKRTGLSKQTIYTVKWKMANKQGLGAIKPQTSTPKTGIASVSKPPVGRPSHIPPEFDLIDRTEKKKSNNRRQGQLKRWARERQARDAREAMENKLRNVGGWRHMGMSTGNTSMLDAIVTLEPKHKSIWQRIKGFFVGA